MKNSVRWAVTLAGLVTAVSASAQRPEGMDSDFRAGNVYWSTVAATDGMAFACIKATALDQGFSNSVFSARMSGAQNAGIYTIPYNRCDPSVYEPKTEAAFFWTWASTNMYGRGYNLSPALDVEDGLTGTYKGDSGSSVSLTTWCNEWYQDVSNSAAAAGVDLKQITYINAGASCFLSTSPAIGGYGWVAWTNCCWPYSSGQQNTGTPWCEAGSLGQCQDWGSGVWSIWQWAWPGEGQGILPGLPEHVDQNVYNGSLSQLEYYLGVGHVSLCSATTSDGRLEIFVVGNTGLLYENYQTTPGGSWSGWISLGGLFGQNAIPSVGVNGDGRLELFVINTNGALDHIWQKVAGNSATTNWSSPTSLGGSFNIANRVQVGTFANGALDVFVVNTNGALYYDYQNPPGGAWTGFSSLGGSWSQDQDIAVQNDENGAQQVLMINSSGNLENNWQAAANSTNWNGWNNIGGTLSQNSRTAAAWNSSDEVGFFTIGTNTACYYSCETAPNSPASWNTWTNLGGSWQINTSEPFEAQDTNGNMEVFLVGHTGNMYHNYQTGAGWSGWKELNGTFSQSVQPCVGENADGRLEVFSTTGTESALYDAYETTGAGTNWSGWNSLGGSWR